MVQLNFTVQIEKDLDSVWNFFSEFTNLPKWDPNSPGCDCIKDVPNKVDSQYKVRSIFNDNESTIDYRCTKYTKNEKEGYISLYGQNDMITAFDEIICRSKGNNKTQLEYRADICLRGIKVLFTPFILCSLNKIVDIARVGCVNKAREMWGKAE